MMSDVIRQETVVFLLSVLHGVMLTFLYDLLRALRRAFRHGVAAISIEDFLFWLAAGFLTFCLAFSETDGVIRWYVAVGIAAGAALYHETASPWIVRGLAGLLRLIKGAAGWVIGRIRRVVRILSLPVKKFYTKIKKRIEKEKKTDYNRGQGKSKKKGNKKSRRGKEHGKGKKTQQE